MDDDRHPIEIHDGSKWADEGKGIGGPTICTVNADGSCSPMLEVFPLKPAEESEAFAEMLVHRANAFPAMLAALKHAATELNRWGDCDDAPDMGNINEVIANAEKP